MKTPLLVFTSDNPFGELVRQGLEETGQYNVHIFDQGSEAEKFLRENSCPLAFLDTVQTEVDTLQLGLSLRKVNTRIRYIIASNSDWIPSLEKLAPIGYLSKPFNLPDLLEMVSKALSSWQQADSPEVRKEPADSATISENNELPWLADVNRAAQHLTRLTLESSAQAALITRQDTLWAYAGQLPQEATRELAETVTRYWDKEEESDLVRFISLNSTKAEHMLYATKLTTGLVLALIFDSETPFSTIRTQASRLVHSLSVSPVESEQEEDEEPGPDLTPLSEILADVPPPNPPKDIQYILPQPLIVLEEIPREVSPAVPFSRQPSFSRESSPAIPLQAPVMAARASEAETDVEQTEKSKSQKKSGQPKETSNSLEDTQPRHVAGTRQKIILEPASPAAYNLTYACLLISRFAHHHLTGDLADRLSEWVPQICVAFGWRLEYISIRPDYLQWIVNVPPSTSPGYLMRVMRQQTSNRIFEDFPRFKKDNPSGDFWAPGYLIMGGTQPHPAQLVKDFIAQTRQRQGISKPLNPR